MANTRGLQVFGCVVLVSLACSSLSSICSALTDAEAAFIARRQLLTLPKDGKLPDNFDDEYGLKNKIFSNDRLKKAYVALQAIKVIAQESSQKTQEGQRIAS
ncbi:hypothetical protein WN943_024525 [Citrus x changshan-huyou]